MIKLQGTMEIYKYMSIQYRTVEMYLKKSMNSKHRKILFIKHLQTEF